MIQQLYNGILRFTPLKNLFRKKTGRMGAFPKVGFLSMDKKQELEENLGTQINHPEFFEQALTHRSYLQVLDDDSFYSNERLEFLGDAVLGMIVGEYLFSLHSNVLEGELTKMRSWLVSKNSLALCAKKLNLDEFIMLSHSAEKCLQNGSDSILADALEAVIAAIYLDSGIESVKKFIINQLMPIMMSSKIMVDHNFKSLLLEKVQGAGKNSPYYELLDEKGPDHEKIFTVGVYVDGEVIAKGTGRSKKQAEQFAAEEALKLIDNKLDLEKSTG